MKISIRNDYKTWFDDDVLVGLFAIAVVTVLGATLFRDTAIHWILVIVSYLV